MARQVYAIRSPKVYKAKVRPWPDGRVRFKWVVDLRLHGRKRSRLFFDTEDQARTNAQIEVNKLMNEGMRASQVAPGLREEAIHCQELLKERGVSLTDAVKYFLNHSPRNESKTLKEAVELFLASRIDKNNSDRSVTTFRGHLKALMGFMCGHPPIHEVTTEKIEKYFEKKKFAAKTRNNHLGTLKTFFKYCLKNELCTRNPAEPLEKAKTLRKRPVVFTPTEARGLMAAASIRYKKSLAIMAIGLFSGVRSCELLRLEVDMIKRGQRIIDIPAEISKTRQRRLVPISDNLNAWLEIAPMPGQGRVFPYGQNAFYANYVAMRAAAGVEKKTNGMRHSFATYDLAMHSNVHETSRACGHSVQILSKNYDAVATKDEGKAYWAIFPK